MSSRLVSRDLRGSLMAFDRQFPRIREQKRTPAGPVPRRRRHSPRPTRIKEKAFTLVEVAAVLVILAVTAASVTLSLRPWRRSTQMAEAVEQLKDFDRQGRMLCRRRGRPCLVTIDLGGQRIERSGMQSDTNEDWGNAWRPPPGYAMTEACVGQVHLTHGRAALPCTAGGHTASYAVRLAHEGGQSRWVLLAGLSGAAAELDDERAVRDILAQAAAQGADAR